MSVTPIVCDTVADGLACGRRTLAGCCAKANDAAHEVMRAEIAKSETRLAEIILNLLTLKCGAHYVVRAGHAQGVKK
jgi:tagatose-1,6-bisphosphate aldolase